MRRKVVGAVLAGMACASVVAVGNLVVINLPISTGKLINPDGPSTDVGSFPGHMILSPDGKFVLVSNFGFRQQLSVLDSATGQLLSTVKFDNAAGPNQMYFGLVFGLDGKLYVSEGGMDQIGIVDLASDGTATLESNAIKVPSGFKNEPNYVAGLAMSADGKQLLAVGNESYFHLKEGKLVGGQGSLNVVDVPSGQVSGKLDAGGFPFDVAAATSGPATGSIYCSSERDNGVYAFKSVSDNAPTKIATGANAANILFNKRQSKLYVSNPGSDTVSVIDTGRNEVESTILLRPPQERGLPGVTPLGLALSPDEGTLYVAAADLNAVAVVDTSKNTVKGYIPVGWYPTSVVVSPDGRRLFVANAKGVKARVPNDVAIKGEGSYIENILEGTVTTVDLVSATADLDRLSHSVLAMNKFVERPPDTFTKTPIDHVIYVIKENRTYDQIFGDMTEGNGDPKICMFPESVTPNQHALARRFELLDDFFVCAQVSADGWEWSTAGATSDYDERNVVVNYAGRGRGYDFEGETNDMPGDLYGVRDVSRPAGGYIWDAAAKAGVSYRNYGFYVDTDGDDDDFPLHNEPTVKGLQGKTDVDFREFDTAYADSDAWVKLNAHAPKQMLKFGSHQEPCRFLEWKREFDEDVTNHSLPRFSMLRLMRDHTAGTAAGQSSPRAMVADNDYAIGELVDTVSHSPYWKNTVICILEDDAQAGQDHVDCHRSPALLISPYIAKGTVDHRFWNTDSMLRTIEVILGLKPMSQYDGFAAPIDVFGKERTNVKPYDATMANSEIINEVNTRKSYRAADSATLIDRFDEKDAADLQLNDILMGDYLRWKQAS